MFPLPFSCPLFCQLYSNRSVSLTRAYGSVTEGEPGCPNCVSHHHAHQKHHRRPDKPPSPPSQQALRLEAIKSQILSKLGLAARPNVTLSVPREVVRDTIERAEAEESVEEDTAPPTTRLPHQEPAEQDDYYGRTREIITFAEPGNKPPWSYLG